MKKPRTNKVAIQAAYEALTQPLSVGAMLKAAHRGSTT